MEPRSRRPENRSGEMLQGKHVREDLFRLVVQQSADAIVVLNLAVKIFGFPIDARAPQELDILRPKEDSRVAEMRVVEIERNGQSLYVANLRDITEHVRLREALRAMSLVDELTGLYNRRGFLTFGRQQLKIANRTKRGLFLLFLDLDAMKWINDTQGHHEGDLSLTEVADVLRETFRESDIVARVGGDEFAVIAVEARRDSEETLVTRLRENLSRRNASSGRGYALTISLGVAHYDPEHPCSIDELLTRADDLMYEDKRRRSSS